MYKKSLAKWTFGFLSGALWVLAICMFAMAPVSQDARGAWAMLLIFSSLNVVINFVYRIINEWN